MAADAAHIIHVSPTGTYHVKYLAIPKEDLGGRTTTKHFIPAGR